ncbi:hypothetical protein SAMD00023353_3500720 [Rosellinia necatrix]|uniref:Uncharacterized protein n=1 Tax=Rosellinia necatrix TaxID=77044 RepID=A0A1W2TMS7_ROSNE|nr:hypothetical protein SAMD00023353_3500720 [Rosellinia necatrix]
MDETMDDTTILISELLNKLAELDQKVCDYRQDMASEFQRYSHRLLHDVPEHVSARVEKVLADELHNYPALGPRFVLDTASSADLGRSAVGRWSRRGRVSPPPVLPHTSGIPPNDGSPPDRGRERDFHGLFTPSFLPLLDVMQPSQSISTPTTVLSSSTARDIKPNNAREPSSYVQLDAAGLRPDFARNCPEEIPSSITSDDSGSRTRRSALRRSSTGSTKEILSPRRVRFDVEGEEVLPTVSPPILPRTHDLHTSPIPDDQVIPIHDSLDHITFQEEISILGNSPPRPKKISSTERLKALARNSTEDTSKWTVVGEMHDDDEEEEGLVMFSLKRRPKATLLQQAPDIVLKNGTGLHETRDEQAGGLTQETHDKWSIGEVAGDKLGLASVTSIKGNENSALLGSQQAVSESKPEENSNSQQVLTNNTKSPGPAPNSLAQRAGNPNEEDMFSFDDDDSELQHKAMDRAPKYIEEEESGGEEEIMSLTGDSAEIAPVALYSTSPAIPIAKPASLPPTPSTTKHTGPSMGSYMGVPFTIGVVRNEEIHQKAIEMGDFYSFVGSVDGRSGMDASDRYSFTGTPRSLGERLMEEAHARRIAERARK